MDKKVNLKDLQELARKFRDDRDWKQFHTPKNLALDVMVEAAELGELFLWSKTEEETQEELRKNKQNAANEAADVLFALLCFVNASDIDLEKAFFEKHKKVAAKYPVETCKGRSDKYTAYQQCKSKKD